MARVRTDNVFGTITDNPLLIGATTVNSAGLANLAAVTAPDEAIIILDPNRVSGAPEIVVVTAHTASATSATIQRGQFGTTARQHAQGTAWVHGPIASNASSFATAADDQGDFVPLGAWTPHTPTFTNFTLGNGSVVAWYTRVGRRIDYTGAITIGSTSSFSGGILISLPVTPTSGASQSYLGACAGEDISASNVRTTGATEIRGSIFGSNLVPMSTGNAGWAATVPFTWAAGDVLRWTVTYEAAS